MAVLTLAQYKALAGIDSGDTSNDTQLSAVITATQTTVERLLGLKFETATLTEWYSVPFGARSIQLRTSPIQSVTSIQVYYSPTQYIDVNSSCFRANFDFAIVVFDGDDPWWWSATDYLTCTYPYGYPTAAQDGILNYKIVYVGGSASASTDTALQMAMTQAVSMNIAAIGEDPRIKAESVLDHSVEFVDLTSRTNASYLREIFGAYVNGGNL